ncbi:MAG: dTDP-4-amino-4,6-dideoxygalactose transaminase [Candidatus Krumholzibacteriia bacterium]|jgi:dTDP-4-amino-4,6-dideoxygalactose transaminase
MSMLIETLPELAILGSKPAFAEPMHVGAPNIGDRAAFMRRIETILDNRRLSNRGPMVREFEQRVANIAGVKHCIAMCNGTAALEIGARALDLSGEVIVPSFTFVATAHALKWQGLQPVFCDVDPETHSLDPSQVEALITPRTSGILAVHLWGRPAAVDQLQTIADRHNLRLMFDAAHAFGSSIGSQKVGGFGDLEIFSFHATKFLNTAEGGAVVTNDDKLAERVRLMQNFGFVGQDQVIALGINGKMNEMSAAMGLTSLESMSEFLAVARQNHAAWQAEIATVEGLKMKTWGPEVSTNQQYIVVEVDAARAGLDRDQILAALRAENVLARRYFYPGCHRMEPYQSESPLGGYKLPHTEALSSRVLVLPTGTAVTLTDINRMGALLRDIVGNGPEIAHHLASLPEAKI